jgi:uncharacterized protein YebE (UPF0316 family)
MEWQTLLTGILIYFARIVDVAIGTVRTIVTVQGRTTLAFCLGFVEVTIWVTVVGTVIRKVGESPILVVFFALGFASGNVVGILVERKLAFGNIILRVISQKKGKELAEKLRDAGQPVTVFTGEGMLGPVSELYVVCRRRDLPRLNPIIKVLDPNAFIITEQVGQVNKILRPMSLQPTGWRAVAKKK